MSYSPTMTKLVRTALKRGAKVSQAEDCILIEEGDTVTAIPGRFVPARPKARYIVDKSKVLFE